MPFVPVAGTAMCELRYTYLGQQMENTLYFFFDTAASPAILTDIGQMVIDWWIARQQDNVSNALVFNEVFVTDLTTATSPAISVQTPAATTGGKAGDPTPANVSLAISFRTAGRGRSSRGRNYFVGFVDDQVTGNVVNNIDAVDIRNAYTQLISDANDLGTPWVVVSRFSGVDAEGKPIPRAAGVTSLINAVSLVDNDVDSQRRRLNGRGR